MRGKHTIATCARCGKPFWLRVTVRPEGWGRYCGKSCAAKARRAEQPRKSVEAVFWSRVERGAGDDCWEWQGSTDSKGYGRPRDPRTGRLIRAHQLAWELASGTPVPPGMRVLHVCDNPACVRNDEAGRYVINGRELPRFGHLFLGSQRDNIADRNAKGRTARGAQASHAKLEAAEVRAMRVARGQGASLNDLAATYGVSPHQVSLIVRRLSWSHLD